MPGRDVARTPGTSAVHAVRTAGFSLDDERSEPIWTGLLAGVESGLRR